MADKKDSGTQEDLAEDDLGKPEGVDDSKEDGGRRSFPNVRQTRPESERLEEEWRKRDSVD